MGIGRRFSHGSHIGVLKQRNDCHVGRPWERGWLVYQDERPWERGWLVYETIQMEAEHFPSKLFRLLQ